MTDKKLKVNSAAYTELSIQIAVLQASVDKLIQLAMKSKSTTDHPLFHTQFRQGIKETDNTPPQWPLESYTDYLKRIGQYNEARSEDEYFGEVYK